MDRRRLPALDAFRGIAILAVIGYHWAFLAPLQLGIPFDGALTFAPVFAAYGWLGVELFFMISGFLILMTLETGKGALDFAMRRMARLYPTYLVASVLTFVLAGIIAPSLYERSLYDLATTPIVDSPLVNAHHVSAVYWSLVVEVRFYIWVCVIHSLFRTTFDRAWVVFCGFSYGFALLAPADWNELIGADYLPFFTLGIGFLRLWQSRRNESLGHFGVALLGVALFWSSRNHDCDPAIILFVMAVLALLFGLFVRGHLNKLTWAPLLYVGRISYPLYLVHDETGIAIMRRVYEFGVPGPAATLVAAAAVLGLAHALSVLVEIPGQQAVMRWADRCSTPFITCFEHNEARAARQQGAHW